VEAVRDHGSVKFATSELHYKSRDQGQCGSENDQPNVHSTAQSGCQVAASARSMRAVDLSHESRPLAWAPVDSGVVL